MNFILSLKTLERDAFSSLFTKNSLPVGKGRNMNSTRQLYQITVLVMQQMPDENILRKD